MAPAPRIGVFAGTFDPLTNGHLDVIERAVMLFDRVVVAVLLNAAKTPIFSVDERIQMIRDVTSGMSGVEVDTFDGLLVEYVRKRQAAAVIRGLRTAAEFADEWQLALMNRHLNPACETVFLMPSAAHMYVSARLVREVASHGGPLEGLVPRPVAERLTARFAR
jgi:pantetheine-phosphate adenylyltransferase